jgi:hypothetical protein
VRLPRLQFFGSLALVAAEFGDKRDDAGIDVVDLPVGFLV